MSVHDFNRNQKKWRFQKKKKKKNIYIHLTIIPRARMGSESIAHEAEGRIGY